MPAQAVAAWEAQGARVLENRDGLRVVELSDGASTHRIAAIDAETDQGTNVIGLVFMDETDIAEFEELEAEARLLGPSVASAHFKDQSHYHYFFNRSYAYNQGGTYGMSWYMCPEDTANDRIIGDALALALAASSKKALLKWLGGMLFAVNETYFRYYDGSYRGSTSDFRVTCGWEKWYYGNAKVKDLYYYCSSSSYYGKAWDDVENKRWTVN